PRPTACASLSLHDALPIYLRVLGEVAREGYTIVCSEPTAALMLRRDYLDLVDDPDAKLVAAQTVEFTTFLWSLYQAGRLRQDFRDRKSTRLNSSHVKISYA